MVLSEYIKELQKLYEQHGDIPVAAANDYAELYLTEPRYVEEDKKFCRYTLAQYAEGQTVKCIVV